MNSNTYGIKQNRAWNYVHTTLMVVQFAAVETAADVT